MGYQKAGVDGQRRRDRSAPAEQFIATIAGLFVTVEALLPT
jgi:hypothetical protein